MNVKIRIACVFSMGVVLIFMHSITHAKTITVKKDGSGDYRVIQSAVDAAGTGDVIEIHDGTYQENINIEKNGTSDNRFILNIAPNAEVVIDGGSGQYTFDLSPGNHWTIDGSNGNFIIKNSDFGIRMYNASDVEILNLTVTRDTKGGDAAISFEGSCDNGSVHHCILNNYDGYGIINSSSGGSDNIAYYANNISRTEVGARHTRSSNCMVYNNYIHNLISDGHGVYGVYLRDTQTALIYNNVIYDVPTSSGNGIHIYKYGGAVSEDCINNKIFNNTIDSAYKGIRQNGGTDTEIMNNLIINSDNAGIDINSGNAIISNLAYYANGTDIDASVENISDDGNHIYIDDLAAEIQIEDPRPYPYYSPVPGISELRNAGTSVPVEYDYQFETYKNAPPIGAFAGGDNTGGIPSSPENLRVVSP
jgi:hypothetical protein